MARTRFVEHGGQSIFEIDFSGCSPEEALEVIREATEIVASQPPKSLRTLTLVAEARFDPRVSKAMTEYVKRNEPHVCRAAVVGATGIRAAILHTMRLLTARDIRAFDDVDEAVRWLAGP